MRSQILFTLTIAALLAVPMKASAAVIIIDGLTVSGMGRCNPGGAPYADPCIVPGDLPESDSDPASPGNGLEFDWFILDQKTSSSTSFSQDGHFGPGRTGTIATVPQTYTFDLPSRNASFDGETQSFIQTAHLKVDMFADTLMIDAITLTFSGGSVTLAAYDSGPVEGDPPVEIPVSVLVNGAQVPLPSTFALLALGLAGLAARRRIA